MLLGLVFLLVAYRVIGVLDVGVFVGLLFYILAHNLIGMCLNAHKATKNFIPYLDYYKGYNVYIDCSRNTINTEVV